MSEYKKVQQWVIDVSKGCTLVISTITSLNTHIQACEGADPDTEVVCLGQYVPGVDEPVVLANFLSFKATRAEGEAALRPIHDDPRRPPNSFPQSFFAAPTSLPEQYKPQEEANPEGHRYCAENVYVGNDEDVPAVLERAFTTLPSRKTFTLYFSMNPTSRRPRYEAPTVPAGGGNVDWSGTMALSMQTDHYFAVYTIWEEEKDDDKMVGWVRDVMADIERHSEGAYLGDSDFQARRTKFWRDENAKRLMEIRRKWDPEGVICGYLDEGDKSGVAGLKNEHEWR